MSKLLVVFFLSSVVANFSNVAFASEPPESIGSSSNQTSSSDQVQQLNTQIQSQLKQMEAQQQAQIATLNAQIQGQLRQMQTQLESEIQKANSTAQNQIKQLQTNLQQQIQVVRQEALQYRS